MTRFLSDLLGLPELQRQLQGLERLTGHPNTDIRFSAEVRQAGRQLAAGLGLDGADTTPPELRQALQVRLQTDEARLQARYQPDGLLRQLRARLPAGDVFALRYPVVRRLLKADPPRRAMKALGYRSVDSLLKHESPALIYTAASISESPAWQRRSLESYARLTAADFEQRPLSLEQPAGDRWIRLAEAAGNTPVLRFVEIGAVVVLPAGGTGLIRLAAGVVQAANDIRSAASYLQLHQLRPGFGKLVRAAVEGVPEVAIEPLGRSVSWHGLQQVFERFRQELDDDLFAPLVSLEQLGWSSTEKLLSGLDPAFCHWSAASLAGLSDGTDHTSGNLHDVLAGGRTTGHLRSVMQHEILLRYLQAGQLRQAFIDNIHRQLAPALALN